MDFILIYALLFGLIVGTITGLIPGLHINLVAILVLSILSGATGIYAAVFLVAMSIMHTFSDFIPSIYLGAPSDDTAMSILPGHILFMKGRGHEAVLLATIGGLLSLIVVVVLFPLTFFTIPFVYKYIENFLGWILILVVGISILLSNKKVWGFISFFISGSLGLAVLGSNLENPLLSMLAGLFGVSTLLLSLNHENIVQTQLISSRPFFLHKFLKPSLIAASAGSIITLLPGLGPAQAGHIAKFFHRKNSAENYLVTIGGINTASMAFSLITLGAIGKGRNGSIEAIKEAIITHGFGEITLLIIIALTAGLISTILTLKISKLLAKNFIHVPIELITYLIIFGIIISSFYFSGMVGFLVLIISAFVGFIPPLTGSSRAHLMGCLLVPIIVYSLF